MTMSNGTPTPPTVSPAGSSQGYDFWVWLAKNKADLKLILAGASAIGSFYLGKLVMPDAVAGFVATVFSLFINWLSDRVDFKLSQVQLTPGL